MKGRYVRIFHPTGIYQQLPPDITDTLGDQTGCKPNEVRLGTKAYDVTYSKWGMKLTSGSNSGEIRTLTAYDSASKIATVDQNWTIQPNTGSTYILVKPEKVPFMILGTTRAALNFTELEVYPNWLSPDATVDQARTGTATMSSGKGLSSQSVITYTGPPPVGSPYEASNGIDGNYTNFVHSGYDGSGEVWWMVDLKNDVDIYIIRLINRRDGWWQRLLGFQIQILDYKSVVVYTSDPITSVMHAYEVFPPATAVAGTLSTTGFGYSSFHTQWSPFSSCSATCGGGTSVSVRGMIPNVDGREISNTPAALVQSQACNTQACPVYSAWGPYTPCVAGVKTRSRTVVSGVAANSKDLLDSADCPLPPTFSIWSPYSNCAAGKKTRTRTTLSGTAGPGDLLDSADCTMPPTFSKWSPYSNCAAGKKTRTRTTLSGTAGPGDLLDSADCTMPPTFSNWSPYSNCAAGKKTRTRTTLSGTAGPGDLLDSADCTMPPTFSNWSPYSDCAAGKKTRTRTTLSGTAGPGDLLDSADCTMPPTFSNWS